MLCHLIFLALCLTAVNHCHAQRESESQKPLILTPYVESGRIIEGQKASQVNWMLKNVKSHAGYFTVNTTYGRNLFFWYFPAEEAPETSPVMVWLQGGPGGSSMVGLLEEHGPFQLTADGSLDMRPNRWTRNNHVIYLDSPAGTGFSFPSPIDRSVGEPEISSDIHDFLRQFFKLFPCLTENDFYVAGESYAGFFVPSAGYAIHRGNPTAEIKINLKGLIIGDGIVSTDWGPSPDYCEQIALPPSYCEAYNYLTRDEPVDPQLTYFFNQDRVQQRIHVGKVTFRAINYVVARSVMSGDSNFELAPIMSELLEHYTVLYYYGQLDSVCPYPTTEEFTYNLDWSGAAEYLQVDRVLWHVDGELAGYVRSGGNLSLALVRNAGHLVPKDQPGWALDLISRFIKRALP